MKPSCFSKHLNCWMKHCLPWCCFCYLIAFQKIERGAGVGNMTVNYFRHSALFLLTSLCELHQIWKPLPPKIVTRATLMLFPQQWSHTNDPPLVVYIGLSSKSYYVKQNEEAKQLCLPSLLLSSAELLLWERCWFDGCVVMLKVRGLESACFLTMRGLLGQGRTAENCILFCFCIWLWFGVLVVNLWSSAFWN